MALSHSDSVRRTSRANACRCRVNACISCFSLGSCCPVKRRNDSRYEVLFPGALVIRGGRNCRRTHGRSFFQSKTGSAPAQARRKSCWMSASVAARGFDAGINGMMIPLPQESIFIEPVIAQSLWRIRSWRSRSRTVRADGRTERLSNSLLRFRCKGSIECQHVPVEPWRASGRAEDCMFHPAHGRSCDGVPSPLRRTRRQKGRPRRAWLSRPSLLRGFLRRRPPSGQSPVPGSLSAARAWLIGSACGAHIESIS